MKWACHHRLTVVSVTLCPRHVTSDLCGPALWDVLFNVSGGIKWTAEASACYGAQRQDFLSDRTMVSVRPELFVLWASRLLISCFLDPFSQLWATVGEESLSLCGLWWISISSHTTRKNWSILCSFCVFPVTVTSLVEDRGHSTVLVSWSF